MPRISAACSGEIRRANAGGGPSVPSSRSPNSASRLRSNPALRPSAHLGRRTSSFRDTAPTRFPDRWEPSCSCSSIRLSSPGKSAGTISAVMSLLLLPKVPFFDLAAGEAQPTIRQILDLAVHNLLADLEDDFRRLATTLARAGSYGVSSAVICSDYLFHQAFHHLGAENPFEGFHPVPGQSR